MINKAKLNTPGSALVMDRLDKTFHRVHVPCGDTILDLDSHQARLNEASEILSLLITMTEVIQPGQADKKSIAGAANMLRRVVNLINADVQQIEQDE